MLSITDRDMGGSILAVIESLVQFIPLFHRPRVT